MLYSIYNNVKKWYNNCMILNYSKKSINIISFLISGLVFVAIIIIIHISVYNIKTNNEMDNSVYYIENKQVD